MLCSHRIYLYVKRQTLMHAEAFHLITKFPVERPGMERGYFAMYFKLPNPKIHYIAFTNTRFQGLIIVLYKIRSHNYILHRLDK